MAEKNLADKLAEAARAAETGGDGEAEWVRHRNPPKSPSAVYSVRIPVDRIEELREYAAELGVQPTTLIRTWVLAQLDARRAQDGETAQRSKWERDFRATAERMRELLDERPAPWADAS